MPRIGWATQAVLWILTTPKLWSVTARSAQAVDETQLVTTWNPIRISWCSLETQPTLSLKLPGRFLKLGKFCSKIHPTFHLVTKLCRFPVQVSGSPSTDWLSSLLKNVPARLPSGSISASDLMEQWPGVSLTSGSRSPVGRLGGCWSGAWGAGSSKGVHRGRLLAGRARLLLTTGAAELGNPSLLVVQGAISPLGEGSCRDYFCSHGAGFSPHSLKRLSSFFRLLCC